MSHGHLPPEQGIRQRAMWFQEAERLGNVTLACRRLGISHQTLYKWRRRLQAAPDQRQALLDRSRCPHRSPRQIPKALTRRICQLRKRTRLEPRRLWWRVSAARSQMETPWHETLLSQRRFLVKRDSHPFSCEYRAAKHPISRGD